MSQPKKVTLFDTGRESMDPGSWGVRVLQSHQGESFPEVSRLLLALREESRSEWKRDPARSNMLEVLSTKGNGDYVKENYWPLPNQDSELPVALYSVDVTAKGIKAAIVTSDPRSIADRVQTRIGTIDTFTDRFLGKDLRSSPVLDRIADWEYIALQDSWGEVMFTQAADYIAFQLLEVCRYDWQSRMETGSVNFRLHFKNTALSAKDGTSFQIEFQPQGNPRSIVIGKTVGDLTHVGYHPGKDKERMDFVKDMFFKIAPYRG
ncbi:hypothetical protein GOV09_05990 [Candidatus Woesearchaeota archaeon]|nr:hypothetical protein [Candidatus Woesearchaeota archaeon]